MVKKSVANFVLATTFVVVVAGSMLFAAMGKFEILLQMGEPPMAMHQTWKEQRAAVNAVIEPIRKLDYVTGVRWRGNNEVWLAFAGRPENLNEKIGIWVYNAHEALGDGFRIFVTQKRYMNDVPEAFILCDAYAIDGRVKRNNCW